MGWDYRVYFQVSQEGYMTFRATILNRFLSGSRFFVYGSDWFLVGLRIILILKRTLLEFDLVEIWCWGYIVMNMLFVWFQSVDISEWFGLDYDTGLISIGSRFGFVIELTWSWFGPILIRFRFELRPDLWFVRFSSGQKISKHLKRLGTCFEKV